MKKIFVLFLFLPSLLFAQKTIYNCRFITTEKTEFDLKEFYRKIYISKDSITITKLKDGGKYSVYLKVDSIIEKEYDFDGNCTWYYCRDTEKDFFNDIYRKGIVIVPKSILKKYIHWFDFATEVDVYRFRFSYQ